VLSLLADDLLQFWHPEAADVETQLRHFRRLRSLLTGGLGCPGGSFVPKAFQATKFFW
jgi:hypothetical protein